MSGSIQPSGPEILKWIGADDYGEELASLGLDPSEAVVAHQAIVTDRQQAVLTAVADRASELGSKIVDQKSKLDNEATIVSALRKKTAGLRAAEKLLPLIDTNQISPFSLRTNHVPKPAGPTARKALNALRDNLASRAYTDYVPGSQDPLNLGIRQKMGRIVTRILEPAINPLPRHDWYQPSLARLAASGVEIVPDQGVTFHNPSHTASLIAENRFGNHIGPSIYDTFVRLTYALTHKTVQNTNNGDFKSR